ncbi:hypothetical protein KSP40_PGU016495 [Platanthera guangdongensis]|uniref:Uncharacterized protein n=1 Tax=Platanthera guangdongensis TaxID=2320717 RepID=A0ABR2MPF9_9ASPA
MAWVGCVMAVRRNMLDVGVHRGGDLGLMAGGSFTMVDACRRNKESSELRKKLCSTQAKLDAYRSRLKEALHEMQVMDRKYQEASTKLKSLLRTYGQQILDLTKQLVEKT